MHVPFVRSASRGVLTKYTGFGYLKALWENPQPSEYLESQAARQAVMWCTAGQRYSIAQSGLVREIQDESVVRTMTMSRSCSGMHTFNIMARLRAKHFLRFCVL